MATQNNVIVRSNCYDNEINLLKNELSLLKNYITNLNSVNGPTSEIYLPSTYEPGASTSAPLPCCNY